VSDFILLQLLGRMLNRNITDIVDGRLNVDSTCSTTSDMWKRCVTPDQYLQVLEDLTAALDKWTEFLQRHWRRYSATARLIQEKLTQTNRLGIVSKHHFLAQVSREVADKSRGFQNCWEEWTKISAKLPHLIPEVWELRDTGGERRGAGFERGSPDWLTSVRGMVEEMEGTAKSHEAVWTVSAGPGSRYTGGDDEA
jgi:hypothetical protein